MPFDTIIRPIRGRTIDFDPFGVWVGCNKAGNSRDTAIAFAFGRGLANKLHWVRGDKIEIILGNGSDSGMVLLRRSNVAGYTLSDPAISKGKPNGNGKLYTKVTSKPFGDVNQHALEKVTYQVETNGLIIVLPEWIKKVGSKK